MVANTFYYWINFTWNNCLCSSQRRSRLSIQKIKCPRCETEVEKYVACELRCPACGGLIDCSDDQ